MVCVHCGRKTQVINSRLQRRANQVWRRRQCLHCQAIFTTLESPDYFTTWLVRSADGRLYPFVREKLFLSMYKSCQHRAGAVSDAAALSETVIRKLLTQVADGVIMTRTIAATAQVALNRFDKAASVHYQASHSFI